MVLRDGARGERRCLCGVCRFDVGLEAHCMGSERDFPQGAKHRHHMAEPFRHDRLEVACLRTPVRDTPLTQPCEAWH